jgi:adenosylcobinamide-phosphate synthase
MMGLTHAWIFPAAFAMDLLVGDPRRMPHPIRWMGKGISILENRFRHGLFSEAVAGALLALSLVAGTWLICAAVAKAGHAFHPAVGQVVHGTMVFFALSVRSLKTEALKVYAALQNGSLHEAKQHLSMIVGRDVDPLDAPGIVRATVETVAENLVDGVIAPLFFAALGGGPLAMAYKMVNTLDSMIGYQNDRYLRFGRFAARLDDVANFIPARLSAITVPFGSLLTGKSALATIEIIAKDGRKHLSSNAGIPEAAFAGALGVRLGGPSFYEGRLVEKPFIGTANRAVVPEDIKKATDLMIVSACLWFLICWGSTLVFCPWWP